MIKKILIGIDESKYAENAAKYGFDLAKTLNAHVGLVHMIEPVAMPLSTTGAETILGTPMQGFSGVEDTELIDAQNELSENIIERTAKKFGGDQEVTHFNEYGSTAEGIIDCAKEFKADLIIVGTQNRSGLDRLLMGNIAEHVVRHSEIPVLVVPLGS